MQFRLEIVDINGTHFKGLTYIKIDSNNAGTIYEDQNTEWAPLSVDTMDYTVEDMMFVSKKEDSVYFPNLGTKDCLIYEYQYKAGTGIDGSMTVYLEPNSGWAYRIELTVKVSGFEMDFDLPLESTNIHALS